MFSLKGKKIMVAGGAGYLGSAVCRGLAEQGAEVIVADINAAGIEECIEKIRSEFPSSAVTGVVLDIGNEDSIKEAVAKAGALDSAINATFYLPGKTVEELTVEEFDRSMHVNLTGAFIFARECASAMKSGGSITMFSSMYGLVSPDPRVYEPPMKPNPIDYGVAKAGITQMVRYLAVHYGPRGIRVNGIAPGPFPNPKAQEDRGFIERLSSKTAIGRIGQAAEIAGAVAFLVSDEASYVTGEILSVNGGWTAW
jgi:NAD(P)-dependent dehydrogenase (short-subunit alcohol dehydrogenase family)